MTDTFNLQRFLDAQARDYECALQEIRNGFKQTHWIWYVFPQLKGLGHSGNSEYYGISSLEEAQAYYAHPVLGPRLIEITEALLEHRDKSAEEILSSIDAVKVRSCMTLFWIASNNPLFETVSDVFYGGKMDRLTMVKCGVTERTSGDRTEERKDVPFIEIDTEIMVEINNLCHFNEVAKAANLIKYMIPKRYVEAKNESSCIYLRNIYLRHLPNPYSSVVYEELPKDMALFCWKENGTLHGICYVSVSDNSDFRKAFQINFDGMDDNDCDPDELGWYYFMDKGLNIDNIFNYSGLEYVPVFRLIGDDITCCRPPVIRHKYRLKTLNKPCDDYALKEKYYDLYHSGNWNAKRALERGGFI